MRTQFNSEQAQAVSYLDGPLMVLAGAGSGKTRVITGKIAYLIDQCQYQPNHIAAITFTNKAAIEMKHRVSDLIGPRANKVTISTFHSLGVRILREDCHHIGLKPQFSILDSTDVFSIIQGIVESCDKKQIAKAQSAFSFWKNQGLTTETVRAERDDDKLWVNAFRSYQRTLQSYQSVDFDDLITLPIALFERCPDVLAKWQDRFHYLLVDEYQDTNIVQYRLLKLLAGQRAAFTVVGDDNQSIYAWRGANVENLNTLAADYPRLKTIKLEQNYRSTGYILKAANHLITHNESPFDKKLWSALGPGEKIRMREMDTDDHEAEAIAMRILAHKFDSKSAFSDYAILYRSNHQAKKFEQQLREHNIPYAVSGGTSFFERSEIKDISAYLRLIVNSDDDTAFIRAATTPKRGIGPALLEKLGQYAGSRQISLFDAVFESGFSMQLTEKKLEPVLTFCEYINRLSDRSHKEAADEIVMDLIRSIDYEGYLYNHFEVQQAENRYQNLMDFVGWLAKKSQHESKALSELVQTMLLMSILDRQEDDRDMVTLSTIHAAKGLEFNHVFLASLEEGLLPHRESIDQDGIEEERRLMYVGVTRAKRSLQVSFCTKRKKTKEWVACEPSRFIDEMGMTEEPSDAQLSPEELKQKRLDHIQKLKEKLAG